LAPASSARGSFLRPPHAGGKGPFRFFDRLTISACSSRMHPVPYLPLSFASSTPSVAHFLYFLGVFFFRRNPLLLYCPYFQQVDLKSPLMNPPFSQHYSIPPADLTSLCPGLTSPNFVSFLLINSFQSVMFYLVFGLVAATPRSLSSCPLYIPSFQVVGTESPGLTVPSLLHKEFPMRSTSSSIFSFYSLSRMFFMRHNEPLSTGRMPGALR